MKGIVVLTVLIAAYLTIISADEKDVVFYEDDSYNLNKEDIDPHSHVEQRLPSTNPLLQHYHLIVTPDLENAIFDATVHITMVSVLATNSIELNALDLVINEVNLKQGDSIIDVPALSFNTEKETVLFSFEKDLPTEVELILSIEYTGNISDLLEGWYQSKYNSVDTEKIIGVTQLEPAAARRVLPCGDEPDLKATFSVEIIVPEGLTAISNGNIESTTSENGKTRFVFEKTPKMSTYLLALVIGEFESITETIDDRISLTIYTPFGQIDRTNFAMSVAKQSLAFFEEFFGVPYVLNKLDLVAIPDFAAMAMENWGCITFRESAILIDENSSFQKKKVVAEVIAHEIAHQWFGNLVTMKWWNDLWLNEGFAVWASYYALDHIFPEWEVWNQFIITNLFGAFKLDVLSSSHPIDVPIRRAKDINEIFDAISYKKGASLVRMLSSFLGDDVFKSGIQKYIAAFKYGNTRTIDLWNTLSVESGVDVGSMMNSWITQTGYPVVKFQPKKFGNLVFVQSYSSTKHLSTIELSEKLSISEEYSPLFEKLSEEDKSFVMELRDYLIVGTSYDLLGLPKKRKHMSVHANLKGKELRDLLKKYITDRGDTYYQEEKTWDIPLTIKQYKFYDSIDLNLRFDTNYILMPVKNTPVSTKGNSNSTGYYRVKYEPDRLANFAEYFSFLTISDLLNIENDIFNIWYEGGYDANFVFSIISVYQGEENHYIWEDICDNLQNVIIKVYNTRDKELITNMNVWMREMFTDIRTIGWESKDPEKQDAENQIRRNIFSILAAVKDKDVINEAIGHYNDIKNGVSTVSPDLYSVIYSIAASRGDQTIFEEIQQMYLTSDFPEEKERCLLSLGHTTNRDQIKELLEWLLTDEVKSQDFVIPFISLGKSRIGRELSWTFIKDNFDIIKTKLKSVWTLSRPIKSVLSNFASLEMADEVRIFFEENKLEGMDMTMNQIIESIENNYYFMRYNFLCMKEYFVARDFYTFQYRAKRRKSIQKGNSHKKIN
eukprot:TRINITY_DN2718_c0_g2_i2.p1 TRINITY_DN2718_c0_g2~~TRINITY_DN2718_c0_g2_i2.p1  ORF type:complete len:1004 (-),score=227.69 TRINITY_DN2718_c0_g2_i2:637-3648(-)